MLPFIRARATGVIIGCLALAGCAGQVPDPVIKTVTVDVPVPVSCVPADLKPAEQYPDTKAALLAEDNAIARARLVEEGWGIRDARLAELEGVVAACRAAAPAPK